MSPADPLGLKSFVFIQICWRGEQPFGIQDPFRRIDVNPSTDWPVGQKGRVITKAWQQLHQSHTAGMCILDADVVIDPVDFSCMYAFMREHQNDICAAPVKIWPKSTGFPNWVWANRKRGTTFDEWQTFREDVDTGSFCFTYLPKRLIVACIKEGLAEWRFPNVDEKVYLTAIKYSIPVHLVPGCWPKHMNF